MDTEVPTAVVCDRAFGFRTMVETALAVCGCLVVASAEVPEHCIDLADRWQPDVVLTELWLPEGAVGLRELRVRAPDALIAVVSPLAPEELRARLWPLVSVDIALSKRETPGRLAQRVLDHWRATSTRSAR